MKCPRCKEKMRYCVICRAWEFTAAQYEMKTRLWMKGVLEAKELFEETK